MKRRRRPASTLILEVLLGVANISAGSVAGFADAGRAELDGVDLLLGANLADPAGPPKELKTCKEMRSSL